MPKGETGGDRIILYQHDTNNKIIELSIDNELREYLNNKKGGTINVEVKMGGRWWSSWTLVPAIDGKIYTYKDFTVIDRDFLKKIKK